MPGKKYDLSNIRAIAGGHEPFVNHRTATFIRDTIPMVLKIRSAVRENNIEDLLRLVAGIQPSLNDFQIHDALRVLPRIERQVISQHEKGELTALVDELTGKVFGVIRDMQRDNRLQQKPPTQ
jgi:hypothetical protein